MKIKIMLQKAFLPSLFFAINISILLVASTAGAEAQVNRGAREKTLCKMKMNNKDYQLFSNTNGHFLSLADVRPFTIIPIEVSYPQGIPGEKIVISAEDGGTLDNKRAVMVGSLDDQKRCVFNFQVTDQKGIFEVALRKGKDRKVIQLWVGDDLSGK